MKKMMYVMNVEWNWIKQRPHFMAELMAETFDITIMYQYRYGRSGLQQREDNHLNLHPMYLFPKISGIEKLRFINDMLLGMIVKKQIKKEHPDFLYLTYPTQFYCVPKNYTGKVIYDCMDDHPAFVRDEKAKTKLLQLEKSLCERCDYMFVTSENLLNKCRDRYDLVDKDIQIVRNAYDGNIIEQETVEQTEKKLKLAYVGTISSWFNFSVIKESLEEFNDIEYYIYGPIDGVEIPDHDRIKYMGTVEHEKLYSEVKDKDVLLMPFTLNEIIEAVDPVKLYEYINFNKNIVCVKYKEIQRFEQFVYFYNTHDEYMQAIRKLREDRNIKYSLEQREEFLEKNNWKSRAEFIVDIIS